MSADASGQEPDTAAGGQAGEPADAGGQGGERGHGGPAGEPGGTPGQESRPPSEEELRAAYEAELSRITSTDMIAQSVVSLLNIAARRLGPPAEAQAPEAAGAGPGAQGADSGRDLDQVRDAIDAVRALLDILERSIPAQELRSLRDALSQLQMAYAREIQASGESQGTAGGPGGQAPAAGEGQPPAEGESSPGAGPAVSSGRLWVPGR
jgi:hypothetical protein